MKQRWIRRVAVVLVLCLLFNENLTGIFMRTQAVETSEPVASFGVSEGDTVSSGEVVTGKEEISEETVSESDIEEQELMREALALAALLGDAAENQYTIPADLETYQTALDAGRTEFYIATAQDYINAQFLSTYEEVQGFKGITLTILEPGNSDKTWDISTIAGFTGIGTATYPFQGTIRCYYENGEGVRFNLDKPLLAYMGDGAVFTQFDITSNGSSAAIAQNISGNVSISNVWLQGAIGSGNGTVGTIASAIGSNSNVALSAVKVTNGSLTVSGTIAGGLAGSIADNVILSLTDDVDISKSNGIEVSGTEAAGGCYGVVMGSHTWNLADKNMTNAKVVSDSASCYAGQFAGQLLSDNGSGTLTVNGGNTLTVNVSGSGNSGGLVGLCGEAANIVLSDGSLTISGTVDSTSASSGGVAGVIANSQIELADYTITARVGGVYAGGIAGQIQGGKYIIRNVSVAEVTGPTATGGVAAQVSNSAAIELQGRITLTGVSPHGNGSNGFVVGKQDKCLIYLSEVEGLIDGVSQLSFVNDDREDIGTYGGLYRNQAVGNGKLIGDGTLANVGVINNTVTKDGVWYQLKSAADFVNLAIVLGTDGVFGTNAFNGASWSDLLAASYTVTSNVDISYDKTGIVTLNRNDKSGQEAYAFSGKMSGAYDAVTITKSSDNAQSGMGLFSSVTNHPEFSNLVFEGTVTNAKGYGGIAYEHIGSGATHGMTLNNITMRQNLSSNTGWVGGVMARKTSGGLYQLTAKGVKLDTNLQAVGDNYSGFFTYITNADVDIDGVTIGGSISGMYNGDVGGFMGKTWNSIGGTVKNIAVQEGTQYTSGGSFGVLWNSVANRASAGKHLTLDTVKLDGLTVNASANIANCGLLFQDATTLVANIVDYDSTGCVVNTPGPNFDEVAGITRSNPNPNGGDIPLPGISGIISLHSSENYFPEYHYENKVESLKGRNNGSTVYYYDVFQYLENADGTVNAANQINNNVLNTPAKVLLWNVLQMAPAKLRDTFKPYFVNGAYPSAENQTYYFQGTLDLSGISYYPTPNVNKGTYIGQNNARIIFGAKQGNGTDAIDMGSWTLSNETVGSQHFGLQGGLLYNEYGNMYLDVSDITLSGTIANLDLRSGALVTGEVGVADGGRFTNITLDNLWVADYNGTNGRVGLLIANLPANTFYFDGIKMINYPQNSDEKAAAALIGYAGGQHVTNLVLNFSNMVIADDVNGNADSNHNGDVLAYASFIYEYDYTDNTEINTGSGIYLFTEEDAGVNGKEDGFGITNNNVTYGKELDDSTEFADSSRTVLSTMKISSQNYKPYVYTSEKIEVNPKAGDILKGCGTYEDPYIIEDEKQFLTLYRYINERELTDEYPTYQYDSFYEQGGGWQLVALGDDSEFCTEKHVAVWNANTGSYNVEVVAYGDKNFPTPEELSHAYFMLGANIDLSAITNETYKAIADDFVGFGTDTRPFAGVWYGAGHSIILPKKVDKTYTNYGFIQYAQGAVVKDIIIKSAQADSITNSQVPFVNSSGGGVIATVLGGDNIIDNVAIAMDIKAQNQYAPIGGYVGVVKKGGIILRNVEASDLSQFRIDHQYSSDGFCVLGAIVGKVEDGYVLYEGSGAGSAVWNGISSVNGYPAAPGYAILNGDTLEASTLTVGEPTSADGMYYDIVVNIPDAAGLQIMSMALNADALNVKPSDFKDYNACGYTEKSRSRKADYSHIGDCTAQTPDYLAAAKYDNVMGYNADANKAYAYPYLYDYMGITGDAYLKYWVDCGGDYYNVLNPSMPFGTVEGTKLHRITWELASNTEYDMTRFGDAFRGIGAVYQAGNYHGGTFHGNFNGNGSTITVALTRKVLDTEKESETIPRAGLFNTIYGGYIAMYNIPADFSKSEVAEIVNCFEIKDFKLAGSIDGIGQYPVLAGGVVACMEGANYIFSNISVDTSNPLSIGAVNDKVNVFGGIIGWIGGASNVLIRNCELIGTEEKPIAFEGAGNGGGLVGNNYGKLKIESVKADYLQIDSSGNAGGLVGYAQYGETICVGTQESPTEVSNSVVLGYYAGGLMGSNVSPFFTRYFQCSDSKIGVGGKAKSVGGVIGYAHNVNLSDVTCERVVLSAYNSTGAIAGETARACTSSMADIVVKDITNEDLNYYTGQTDGIGGIVGKNGSDLTIQRASVSGTATDKYSCSLTGYKDKLKTASSGVGGIVGYHESNTLNLQDCKVDNIYLSTDIGSGSKSSVIVGAGGLVGCSLSTVQLAGEIVTSKLSITAPYGAEASNTIMAAGGAFGYVANSKIVDMTDTYYTGIVADSNAVAGKQAGGLIGYNSKAQIRFSGAIVKNGTVQSDELAGGFMGHLTSSYDGVGFNAYGQVSEETQNKVLDMNISGRVAGGLFGRINVLGPVRCENILVQKNNIIGYAKDGVDSSAGGLIGVCESTNNVTVKIYDVTIAENQIAVEVDGEIETDCVAAGGVIGQVAANTMTEVAELLFDKISLKNSNAIGIRTAGSTDIKLVKADGTSYSLADIEMPVASDAVANDYIAIDMLEETYGCYIGTMVGVYEATNMQMYVICSDDTTEKYVTPVMTANPPVVDVGRNSTQTADTYRSYCHIIYGAKNEVAKSVDTNLADMKAEVTKAKSAYTAEETAEELLTEVRVSKETIDLFELVYRDRYQFPETELAVEFPVIVYRVQDGTLQQVMEAVTDVMTNMAGASSSDMKQLNIECRQMFHDGTENKGGTPSVVVSRATDGATTYSYEQYDGLLDGKMTYTEIRFTYGWGDGSGQHRKVFSVPVFVEEPILYGVHSKIMEGKISDVSSIKANGTAEFVIKEDGTLEKNNNIIMANDSDYTLLLEYTYGEARKQMVDGVTVDKVFYMEQNGIAKSLPLGTQLLLVDVTGGNKAYYYTVDDTNVTKIRFTDFRDSSGVALYENRAIRNLADVTDEGQDYYTDLVGHTLTETAVERYLLTVFSNDNDTKSKVYSIHAGIQIEDENLASRFQLEKQHNEETVWNITANPGLIVSLVNKGRDTDINGVISKSDGLNVKATFALTAENVYWAQKSRNDVTVIDSSNSGKYLEIAFYLRDSSGKRVALPDGTNFSYKLADGSYSGNRVIPDDTMVYYYKDIRNQFGIENFEYLISDISENTIVPVEYQLDFSGADLSTVLDDSYVAWIELLRTANKDYPMGNGNDVDSYSEVVNANAMRELGFALRSDKLEDLAINTYPEPATTNTIPGHIMFDFSENLELAGSGAGKELVLEKWAGLDYVVTYQLYRKTESGYVPYSEQVEGTDLQIPISISATDQTGVAKSSDTGNLEVTYNFTQNQIEAGNGDDPVAGVLTFPCLITQKTAKLVKETDSLTNYRVEATLTIKEKGVTSADAEKTTDFFVYTVTKLKFDL